MQDLHLCEFYYEEMTGNPPSLLHLHLTSSHPYQADPFGKCIQIDSET